MNLASSTPHLALQPAIWQRWTWQAQLRTSPCNPQFRFHGASTPDCNLQPRIPSFTSLQIWNPEFPLSLRFKFETPNSHFHFASNLKPRIPTFTSLQIWNPEFPLSLRCNSRFQFVTPNSNLHLASTPDFNLQPRVPIFTSLQICSPEFPLSFRFKFETPNFHFHFAPTPDFNL